MTCRVDSVSKSMLLKKIDETSFAVTDIHLYLDTHPCDEKALAYYMEMADKRRELMKEYALTYGPLTIDDARYTSKDTWEWIKQPFPWEREGGRR